MWDTEFFANVLIFFTLATVTVASFKNLQCAMGLAFSLVSARYLTSVGATDWHGIAMFFSACLCVFSFKRGRWFLDIEESEVNYAVAFLYMVRMALVALLITGLVNVELLWVTSMVLLCVQNLLVIGGCLDGYSKRVNVSLTHFRFKADALLFSREKVWG